MPSSREELPLARVDLIAATGESRSYTLSLNAVGQYAYDITTEGDLFVIDATLANDIASQDRLVGTVRELGSSRPNDRRLIGLESDWGIPNLGVLVTDPERQRVWWIASDVDDSRNLIVPLVVE